MEGIVCSVHVSGACAVSDKGMKGMSKGKKFLVAMRLSVVRLKSYFLRSSPSIL